MSKVTVYTDADEWYPVYSAYPADDTFMAKVGDPLEVDAKTAERWARVFADFEAVQREIRQAVAERDGVEA